MSKNASIVLSEWAFRAFRHLSLSILLSILRLRRFQIFLSDFGANCWQ